MQPLSLSKIASNRRYPLTRVGFCLVFIIATLALLAFRTFNLDFAGWRSGFSHPLTGWDHLVTMLAVGIWAAQLRGHAIWLLPLAFVGVMSLGGLAGAAGLTIPSVEGIILLSTAVFSLLILRKVRFSTQVNVMIVAFFAFFHGFAHGQEISTSASLISYTFGFMLATLLLHGAGILVAKLVVLSVTCLMALFLSSMAQANNAESASFCKNNTIHPALELGKPSFSPFIEQFENSSEEEVNRLDAERIAKQYSASFSEQNLQSQSQQGYSDWVFGYVKPFIGLPTISSKPVAQDCHHSLVSVFQIYEQIRLSVRNTDFRRHYPLINHTPGRDLLSNGVGLTSPPALLNELASRHPFHLKLTPSDFSYFEAIQLQNSLAKIDIGISLTKISNNLNGSLYHSRSFSNATKRYPQLTRLRITSLHLNRNSDNLLQPLDYWLISFQRCILLKMQSSSTDFMPIRLLS